MISVIIVNWNTDTLLRHCIASLAALPADEQALIARVIVVDNNSSDSSLTQAETVATSFPLVFLKNEENIGFAQGNNVAFDYLKQFPSTHIFLLNPDTTIYPGALHALESSLKRIPKAGVLGVHIVNPDGSTQPSVRAFPNFTILAFMIFKLHHLFPLAQTWQHYMQTQFDYSREQKVEQVMGAALLIRDQVVNVIEQLDPQLQWWFDDVDLCKRVYDAGWEVWYTPTGRSMHYGGTSFAKLTTLTRVLRFTQSAWRYARKHLL